MDQIFLRAMVFTTQQKHEAYKKLPEEVQELISSNETIDLISESLTGIGLTEDQTNLADSEIFYAMLGLQTLDQAINNISSLSEKNVESLKLFKENLKKNIFDKYNELNTVSQSRENITVITKEIKKEVMQNLAQRVSNARQGNPQPVSQSLPNNLPMVEEGEKVHDVPPLIKEEKVTIPTPITPEPASVTAKEVPKEPIATPASLESQPLKSATPEIAEKPVENTIETSSKPEARYPGGLDPYREPLI